MTNPHGTPIWYELMTTDPVAAKAFYDSVVGWNIDAEPAIPGAAEYRMINAHDSQAGGVLTLTKEMCEGGGRAGWFGYFGVDDVDATAAAITADGGLLHMGPHDIPGVGRIAMLSDPQGVAFYIMRGASDADSRAYQRDGQGHVSWHELMAKDDAAALDFYAKHFNLKKVGAMPIPDAGDYSFLAIGDGASEADAIGAVMTAQPGSPTGWSFYFRVPDIEAAKAKVESGGGTILYGPAEVPGGEMVLSATDPEGVLFGLVAPGK